ncbi:MAG: prephenate dehydratase [Rhodothermales bacterium]|nr:prephenate dehydratase [Rhodothermales bacterium]MBO6779089.1 prephenate dehydratase [Rhodothermales bacterium]
MGAGRRIAFQGEIGAYSEEAALKLYPGAALVPCASFDAVFEALEGEAVHAAVVPIENSLHGSVHANYDLLRDHDVHIRAEWQLRIRHHLLGIPGTTVDQVRTVLSHPQALGQCRDFLKRELPHAEAVPAYDTAGAAKRVAQDAQPAQAAVASESAAREYGLTTLASGIESNPNNYTRFLALEREAGDGRRLSDPKTSVLYVPGNNIPGVLFKSLAVFALRDIDLFKIESRPLVGSPGKYIFYLDLAGSVADETVSNAIGHLQEIAAFVKVLGSYERRPAG